MLPPGLPPAPDELLLSLPAVSLTLYALVETNVFLMFPADLEALALLVAAACMLAVHGGGCWILRRREGVKRRTRLLVRAALPGAELDEGLGFCDEGLRDEFLAATRRERLGHDVYTALFMWLTMGKDLYLWQQGTAMADVPGWAWGSVAVAVPSICLARVLTPRRDPATNKVLAALHVLCSSAGMTFSMTWRMRDMSSVWELMAYEVPATIVMSSWLPYGASESLASLDAFAGCVLAGHFASCFVNWDSGMPWAKWVDPRCPPESIFVPVMLVPIFLGVSTAATLRLWAHSLAMNRFALSKIGSPNGHAHLT